MFCYLVLSVICGFAAYSYVFNPCLQDAVQSGSKNTYTNDPTLTLTVLSIMAGLLGPVTLAVLLVPKFKQRVYDTLSDQFNE